MDEPRPPGVRAVSDDDEDTAGGVAWRPGRLEAFSDGVFAIAITLLVLDIAVAPGWEQDPLHAVLDLWPEYLAYVVSFATIGVIWVGHSAITRYLLRVDRFLVRINLLLLLAVAFLPFPTRLLAQFYGHASAERVATVVLGLNLLLAGALLSLVWRTAISRKLTHPDLDDDDVALLTRRLTPGLGGYVALIVLGVFRPLAGVVGYLVVALALLIPGRSGSARGGRRGGPGRGRRPGQPR